MSKRGMTLQEYCVQTGREELLAQWDTERNVPLTPADVTAGSSRKFWWKDAHGHQWSQAVEERTGRGKGCPYCANRTVLPGFNDLATTHPELAAQWDAERNAPLTPRQVLAGSHKKVWWRCGHGHQWLAQVKARAQHNGCPVCARRVVVEGENDLATTHPELAAQWDAERNAPLTPQQVLSGAQRRVWWRCPQGHSWESAIHSRAAGRGCPYCVGKKVLPGINDLATKAPERAAQWDYEKNLPLTPREVTAFSNRSVWWKCAHGHSYRAAIANCTGCPYCSGNKVLPGFNDLATQRPEVAAQWCQELNAPLTPWEVMAGSNRRVWWTCQSGHVWQAVIYSRTASKPSGCPVCAGRHKIGKSDRYGQLLQEHQSRSAYRQPVRIGRLPQGTD